MSHNMFSSDEASRRAARGIRVAEISPPYDQLFLEHSWSIMIMLGAKFVFVFVNSSFNAQGQP